MRRLTVEEAVPGKRVVYTGRATPWNVTDSDLLDDGRILMENHPGTITRVSEDRQAFVNFRGLEEEPVSKLGFMPDDDGHYPGLVLVSADEWAAASAGGWWSTSAGDVVEEEAPEVQAHIDAFFGQKEGTVVGALLARFGPQDEQVLFGLLDLLSSDTFPGFLSGIREGWEEYVERGAMPFAIEFRDVQDANLDTDHGDAAARQFRAT